MIQFRVFPSTYVAIRLLGSTQVLLGARSPDTVVGRLLVTAVVLVERTEHRPVLQLEEAATGASFVNPPLDGAVVTLEKV